MVDVRESLARALHEAYVRQRLDAGDVPGSSSSLVGWDDLADEFRRSSRRNAEHIQMLVRSLGYDVVAVGQGPSERLSEEEIAALAEEMHVRWADERRLAGWRFGPERDDERRLNPDLVSWQELSEERREINRQLLRDLPGMLERSSLALARTPEAQRSR